MRKERAVDEALLFGREFRRIERPARDAVHDERAVMHDDGNIHLDPLRHADGGIHAARRRVRKMHARVNEAVHDVVRKCACALI